MIANGDCLNDCFKSSSFKSRERGAKNEKKIFFLQNAHKWVKGEFSAYGRYILGAPHVLQKHRVECSKITECRSKINH